jgi:FAD/FMN-containing dehydrogenase
MSVSINDIHSGLNSSHVARVAELSSIDDIAQQLVRTREQGLSAIAAGGRHAMGGQQFAQGGVVLDTRAFNRVLAFDR